MLPLWILLFAIVAGLIQWATWRRIFGQRKSRPWSILTLSLATVGLALGIWLGATEYPVGTTLRMIGIPIPFAFFHWEGGAWYDFVNSPLLMCDAYAVNAVCWSAAAISPVTVSLIWHHAKGNASKTRL